MEPTATNPDDVKQSLDQLREGFSERTQEIRDKVNAFVDEQPLAAVGIAFGVGYLLSGALLSRTTFRAARIGARVAFGGLLKNLLLGVGPGLVLGGLGLGRDDNGNRPQRR